MKRVYICSPYTGDPAHNVAKARALCLKAAAAGFAPFSPQLLYTGLADDLPKSRLPGLNFGLSFLPACNAVWAYVGAGVTAGMARELKLARELDKPVYEFLGLDEPAPAPWPPETDEWARLDLDNLLWAVKEIDILYGGGLLPFEWWNKARLGCSDMLLERGLGHILNALARLSKWEMLPDLPKGWSKNLADLLNNEDNRLKFQRVRRNVSQSIRTDEWHKLARLFMELGGDYERALMFLEKSVRENPKNHLAWQDKGYCLWMLGRPEEASEAYRASLALVKRNAKAWQGLGQALVAQKLFPEAREAFDQGLKYTVGDTPDLAGLRQDAFDLEQGAISD
jgi:tetratricopeptide (TPR) repeat protein